MALYKVFLTFTFSFIAPPPAFTGLHCAYTHRPMARWEKRREAKYTHAGQNVQTVAIIAPLNERMSLQKRSGMARVVE